MGINRQVVGIFVAAGAVIGGIGVAVLVAGVEGFTGPGFVILGLGLWATALFAVGWARLARRRVLRGRPAWVEVISAGDTGTVVNNQPRLALVVDVAPCDGTAPYRVSAQKVVAYAMLGAMQPGSRWPVSVQPGDPDAFSFVDPQTFAAIGGTGADRAA